MKNSLAKMKKRIIPVIMSEAYSLRLNCVATAAAPRSRKMRKNENTSMIIGLNFESHATMIAVKPKPPAVDGEIV